MARNNRVKYINTYTKLLRLYPASYQQRFAEPMLQTFSDLCHEYVQAGRDLRGLAVKTYVGTSVAIVKEHIKEVVMSSKATKIKVLATAGGFSLAAFAAGLILINNNRPAQSIAPYTSLEQVRQLSKGKKDACLMDTQQAWDAVRDDDNTTAFKDEKISNFEMAAAVAIMDVPAGTQYKLTIHSYEDKIARGAMAYEYGYGIYNYEIKKLPTDGEWELVSVVACERL